MKNKVENILFGMVAILLLLIVGLIVKYNMKDDAVSESNVYQITVTETTPKKDKKNDYLKDMEQYSDVDVKVDPKKEDNANKIKVSSELAKDDLASVIEDKSKSSYMKNLENYSQDEKKSPQSEKETSSKDEDEPVKLPKDEIVDDVGMAIDAAIAD